MRDANTSSWWQRTWQAFMDSTEPAEPDRDGRVPWWQSNLVTIAIVVIGIVSVGYGMSVLFGSA